ncbi:hypothetical protein REJC140_00086 [Pseudorhizobium endolithicum]|uniref:Uncharacterized protein n=1 Tax=Pseudorhizobium endolithicum TaxID=1191678 RepID=A0ABN7JAY6_9HYPH|nr:hypothetical protein [Pseudorhizobium endolithicum]CAD7023079.1 hypothetical protein REJC140_00086 [Pseudorhizobium endolithicum]
MLDGDLLCRAALYPKFVTPEGIFDEEMLLTFMPLGEGESYALSVASHFLSRGNDGVHSYGCGAATIANERFVQKNQRAPSPVTEEVHYLGFYQFTRGQLMSIEMSYYSLRCFWKPEHGADMHFQVEFVPKGAQGTRKERRQDRRAAVGMLTGMLRGPHRHICQKDLPHKDALEAVDLPALPRLGSL